MLKKCKKAVIHQKNAKKLSSHEKMQKTACYGAAYISR
jgi:hypothetical protein